jgi:hypothetical protein
VWGNPHVTEGISEFQGVPPVVVGRVGKPLQQASNALDPQLMDVVGKVDVSGLREDEAGRFDIDGVAFDPVVEQLHGEQRVALGPVGEVLGELRVERKELLEQLLLMVSAERGEFESRAVSQRSRGIASRTVPPSASSMATKGSSR